MSFIFINLIIYIRGKNKNIYYGRNKLPKREESGIHGIRSNFIIPLAHVSGVCILNVLFAKLCRILSTALGEINHKQGQPIGNSNDSIKLPGL
jgi:hypothetical protein